MNIKLRAGRLDVCGFRNATDTALLTRLWRLPVPDRRNGLSPLYVPHCFIVASARRNNCKNRPEGDCMGRVLGEEASQIGARPTTTRRCYHRVSGIESWLLLLLLLLLRTTNSRRFNSLMRR